MMRVPGGAGGGFRQTVSDTASAPGGRSAKKKGSIFLNDSTKSVYGPKTTLWTTGFELFINRARYRPIDTGILNYHRWTYPQRLGQTAQDLGNVGTALTPLFPSIRSFSGAVSGFDAYDPYYFSEEPTYFDTKSPYSRIQIIWGGGGRSMTRVEFKRNINPRWNFGFNYRPLLVDKQLDKRRKGDRHVSSEYYDFHSSYRSKNDRYQAWGFYRRLKHKVNENGGVFLSPGSEFSAYFATDASPVLYKAQTVDLKRELQFNHQYRLASALELYQSVSLTKQQNDFTDTYSSSNNLRPYDAWFKVKPDTLQAADRMNFSVFRQEAGFKGRKNFLFYNAYYTFRKYNTTYRWLDPDTVGVPGRAIEHFVGGRLVFDIDSLTRLAGKFEINQRGFYSLEAQLDGKFLEGRFTQSLAAPGMFHRAYRGVHDYWVNKDLRGISGLQAEAFVKVPTKKFQLSPGLGYSLYSGYLFLKKDDFGQAQTVLPVQSGGTQSLLQPQLRAGISLMKKLNLNVSAVHSLITANADQALQIPDWLINGQLAFHGMLFKGNLEAQIGFDLSWRSAWYAPGYDPVTQHYFVQTDERVDPWLGADFFINGRIRRGRFFYKVHNLMQAGGRPGYLLGPGYPGQRTIMDFGFELVLFD